MRAATVLMVDCPRALQEPLRAALLAAGLLPADEAGGSPDALLVWLDPYAAGAGERLEQLRAQQRLVLPAVVVVGPEESTGAMAAAAAAGADALTSGADPQRLASACLLALGCARRFAGVSPLTGLPGNAALQREIARRLPERGGLAVLAFDLDDFKGYNDRYGYSRGDALLRYLYRVVVSAVTERAGPGWFAAHVGGDDFFALVRPAEAQAVAERAIELFAADVGSYYDPADRARGAITVRTRTGEVRDLPLTTITVAAVTNEADDLTHPGQLAAVLAELKACGKRQPGSSYVPDRRRVHDAAAAPGLGARVLPPTE